jgi:hypothetical protein
MRANLWRRAIRRLPWAVALLALAGCQEEGIRRYKVPKPEPDDPATMQRLLGAIFPRPADTWVFKLSGPLKEVGAKEEAFKQFLQSIRFGEKADKPIEWKVPEGWKQEPGNDNRYATLRTGEGEYALEVTVTKLPPAAAALLPNVNRWCGQLGLRPVSEDQLAKVTRELKVEGATGTLVDLTGPGSAKTAMKPPPAPKERPKGAAAPEPSLKYTRPEGWVEAPDLAGGFIRMAAAFRATDGGKSAEVTVTPLGGDAGGLLPNVNRWRDQVKLGPIDEGQLRKDVRNVEVAGRPASYLDLLGPEGPGRERMLVVVVPRGGQTWFFKMRGPAELVAKQQAAFEAFMKSVKFDGGTGAADE